jgi:predicted dehydrogenase
MSIALVGCGAIARSHMKALRKMDGVHVAAVCDTDEEAAARMAKQWNIRRYYTSFSKMLDNEDLSIVSILTPAQSHALLAIEAVNHGVNVLVEKPFAVSSKEAALILDSLKDSSVKLTVDYNWLMSRAMTEALSLARNGKIGEVLAVDIKILHTKQDSMASDKNHWSHTLHGGRFGEMLPHPVYLAQTFLGDSLEILRVHSRKRGSYGWMRYDELYALLEGEAGTANIYVSFNSPRPVVQLDIYGTEKILIVDLLNQTLFQMTHRTYRKMDAALDCIRLSWQYFFYTIRNTATYLSAEAGQTGFQMAYRSLIESINTNGQPLVTPEMAYCTVKTVEEICNEL